jgi:short-subunit dehydrogenase
MTVEVLTGAALITGASAGIGAAFSRRLAAEGRSLVLVARDATRLSESAAELTERYAVSVQVLAADLATAEGCELVSARLADTENPVDTLINNAGFGLSGPFGREDIAAEQRMVDVNIRAVLVLSHVAVGAMRARGRGEILNVSSVAGLLPAGTGGTYAASKTWVTAFTEHLAVLLAGTGVRVSALCPGFTRSEFHQRAGVNIASIPRLLWLDADEVVAEGLHDLRRGKVRSVPSYRYRVLVGLSRVVPRPLLYRAMTWRRTHS